MTSGLSRGSTIKKMVNGKWLMFNVKGKYPLTIIHYTLYIGAFLSSCQTDIQTINQFPVGKDLPSEIMKDAEIIYSDSAKVKMKLTGPKLERYSGEKPHIIFPDGVNILFYDNSMKVNSHLKADYGIRYEADEIMEAKRNVEVVNVKGQKLNTEDLIMNEAKDSIYTNAFVKITEGDDVIYGDGLISNRDFTKWRIKNVKGTKNLKDDSKEKPH